ncbi:MAG: glycine oxidase ThiO, partial [Cyanobacteria bacterium J06636_16]
MTGTPDVLIVGGGIIGLAIALRLRQSALTVTVLSRNFAEAASHAAAGMLAPGAEAIPPGPFLDLCRQSLQRYPDWVRKLETLTGQDVGYWPSGILAPQIAAPTDTRDRLLAGGHWLDASSAGRYQPGLTGAIAGAWWYPEDGQVDNRALTQALRGAVQDAGVEIQEGVDVYGFVQRDQHVQQIQTSVGDRQAGHYVLATGAWSNALLPIPVLPLKGQMAAVQAPPQAPYPQPLQRVLFGSEGIYLVPRRNGRIVLGATVETVGFTPGMTPAGFNHLFHKAVNLFPVLKDFPVQETWWGFRPSTPDEAPILGPSSCDNLTLATGHHRNGILLAPITAELVSDYILGKPKPLMAAFAWERFEKTAPFVPTLPATRPMQILERPVSTLETTNQDTPLVIAGRQFRSRLMTGTGKYSDFETMRH